MNKKEQYLLAKALYIEETDKGESADKERLKNLKADMDAKKIAWEEDDKASKETKDAVVTDAVLKTLIFEQVSKALKDSGMQDKAADTEAITRAVDAALQKHSAKEGREKATSACREAMQTVLDDMRRENKFKHSTGDADSRGQIEIPCSWSKGNLPLHAKQLLNIITAPVGRAEEYMNKGIDEADLRKGAQLGDRVLNDYRQTARMAVLGQKNWRAAHKALTIGAASGSGVDLLPTDLSAELQRRFYLSTEIAAAFSAREIAMPSETYTLPLSTTLPSFYLGATGQTSMTETSDTWEVTAATESSPGTGLVTLTAKEFVGETDVSYAVEEDSIIPVLPFIQERLSTGAAHAFETALINGDTTATHFDSDIHATSRHAAKAWKGFRRLAYDVSALFVDHGGSEITWDSLIAMRKAMGKYSLDPKALIWIVGPSAALQFANIQYARTIDQFGQKAVIVAGAVDEIMGIPVVPSEYAREILNASGVYNASGTAGAYNLVRPDQFIVGSRRTFMVETFRNIQTRNNIIVASFRRAFAPMATPSTTIRSLACGYNFAV